MGYSDDRIIKLKSVIMEDTLGGEAWTLHPGMNFGSVELEEDAMDAHNEEQIDNVKRICERKGLAGFSVSKGIACLYRSPTGGPLTKADLQPWTETYKTLDFYTYDDLPFVA